MEVDSWLIMKAAWEDDFPNHLPSRFSFIGFFADLYDGVENALKELPHTKGVKDEQAWGRWEYILRQRFDKDTPKTQAQVGEEMGLARTTVQRREFLALMRIKANPYLEARFISPNPREALQALRSKIETYKTD